MSVRHTVCGRERGREGGCVGYLWGAVLQCSEHVNEW